MSFNLPSLFQWKHSAPRKSLIRLSRPGSNNYYTLERSQENSKQAEKHTVTLTPLQLQRRNQTNGGHTPKPRVRPARAGLSPLNLQTHGSPARPRIYRTTSPQETALPATPQNTPATAAGLPGEQTNQHSWLGLGSLRFLPGPRRSHDTAGPAALGRCFGTVQLAPRKATTTNHTAKSILICH